MTDQNDDEGAIKPVAESEKTINEGGGSGMDSQPEMFSQDTDAFLAERHRLQVLEEGGIAPDSWCPGGSASGGICTPPNNNRSRWMEMFNGARNLPIGECLLLGAHNAGFDKKAPRAPSNETCQDIPIGEQLAWGVRVLDLRVQFYGGASGATRFAIFHDGNNGRYVEPDVLDQLLSFRKGYNAHKEIVVLDFHGFKNFTPSAHQELRALIIRKLGAALVPPECAEAAIAQLWELNKNTVVAYNDVAEACSPFWHGVNQRWLGDNTPEKDEMASFIKEVGSKYKKFGALRSVQAAYYSLPAFVPKDLSEDLMGWFKATDDGGPIGGHYIITTDWCLRQRLADNVIFANGVRSRRRNAYVLLESPDRHGSQVSTYAYNSFLMGNGYWSGSLTFGPNTSFRTSIVLIVSHASYESEIRWDDGSVKKIKNGTRLLFSVKPYQSPQLIWEEGT